MLFIVDNRAFRRLMYTVLDRNPTQDDIRAIFRRFKAALDARGLKLAGATTDGSPLYPEPIAEIFGDNSLHQVCEFHVIAELTKAVLKAVAHERRKLKACMPVLPRGRPRSRVHRRDARRKKRLQARVTDLFDHRYLFVKHHLTPGELRTLRRIMRSRPVLATLRAIMTEVYRLFDRRCRMDTALAKLAALRRRVRRFKSVRRTLKKLFAPTVEKALTFLDESLLPSTSNAVERGNRRYRKMQKTVYRVRTADNINARIALDMQRDAQAPARLQTVSTLHLARSPDV